MSGEGDGDKGATTGQGIIARLASRNRGLRDSVKALSDKLQQAQDANKALAQQVEQFKAASDPQGLATKVKELEAEVRTRDHRAVFDRLARAAGVREDGLDDLWQLSGYKPESDAPDEAALTATIADQKGKRGYLFGQGQGQAEGGKADPPAPKPGPAGGKGGTSTTGTPHVSEDLVKSDPIYVMKNYDKVVAAAKANAGLT